MSSTLTDVLARRRPGLAIALLMVVGCSGTGFHRESAANAFDAVSFALPHRILDSEDLRSGGRRYVIASQGELNAESVSARGYTRIGKESASVATLRGPDPTAGRVGDCSVTVNLASAAPPGLGAGEVGYDVIVECATKPAP
jgi:hypothetical protein